MVVICVEWRCSLYQQAGDCEILGSAYTVKMIDAKNLGAAKFDIHLRRCGIHVLAKGVQLYVLGWLTEKLSITGWVTLAMLLMKWTIQCLPFIH